MLQLTVYGLVVSVPTSTVPSRYSSTFVMPLALDALTATETVPLTTAPAAGDVTAAVGAPLAATNATALDVVELPAVSVAVACTVCGPSATVVLSHGREYGAS